MRSIVSFFKFIIFLAAAYIGLLYLTRPEMDIPPQTFINLMRDRGYMVYKSNISAKTNGATVSYIAMSKDKKIKINYVGFNDSNIAHDYYLKNTDNDEVKYSVDKTSEIRLSKNPAEKQSYVLEDIYYSAIYTKNCVIYTNVYNENRGEISDIFNKLYKSPNIDFSKLPDFKNLQR